jgi:hypothetical protein
MNSVKLSDVVISNSEWKIETIARYFSRNIINFSSEIAPVNEWNNVCKSRFIESLILGLPVPQLVLAHDAADSQKFVVIDGRQRLLAISQFYDEEFALTGLELWQELEGHTYDSIESNLYLRKAIDNLDASLLRVVLIRNWQDESLLSDIRSRLKPSYDE